MNNQTKTVGIAAALVRCTRYIIGIQLGLAMLSGSAAFAQDKMRVGKSGAEAFAFLPANIGAQIGIFKKHGLDVTVTVYGGGAKLQQGLASDAIDIGLGSGPEMVSIIKGSPVKAVAMMMAPPDLLVPVVRADGSVKSWDDLKGKRVAVSQITSLTGWLVKETARRKGWGPTGIQLVAVGDQRARIAALKTNQVEGMVIDIATALAYQKAGDGKLIDPFGKYIDNFIAHVVFASDKVIAEHPDRVKRFLAGWFETIKWMADNRDKTIELAKGMMNVDADIAGQVYDRLMPGFSRDGIFRDDGLKVLAQSYVDLGSVKTAPDMKPLYTEQFLPAKNAK
jgi:NitT/TauT family transport system substrate-binding protein